MRWNAKSSVLSFALLVGLATAVSALASHNTYNVIYAGPKTWLSGYSAAGAYDFQGDRWFGNGFYDINPPGCARVVLIDGAGGWHRTYDACGTAIHTAEPSYTYQKKPYCQNISIQTYTGYCMGDRTIGHG